MDVLRFWRIAVGNVRFLYPTRLSHNSFAALHLKQCKESWEDEGSLITPSILFTGWAMRRKWTICYSVRFTGWVMRRWRNNNRWPRLLSPRNKWWEGEEIVLSYSFYSLHKTGNEEMRRNLLPLFVSRGGWWEDDETAVGYSNYSLQKMSDNKKKKKCLITHSIVFTGWVIWWRRKRDDSLYSLHRGNGEKLQELTAHFF